MMAPAAAARALLISLAVGGGLGLLYGFLRPLRPRLTALCDLVFVLAAFYGWLYIGFGVCGGDLRFGCTLAIAAGGFFWEWSIGRWLRPIFRRFWRFFAKTVGFFLWPAKKIFQKAKIFAKFLLASGKKWFTIRKNNPRNHPIPGGTPHGKKKNRHQAGVQKIQPPDKSRPAGRRGAFHHRTGDPARLHRSKS